MVFSKDSHGYVYKWTELSTKKWYIGCRSAKNCHVNDGYICSSRTVKPLITNNPENWIREILWIGDREITPTVESLFLSENNAANNDESYNLHNSDGKWNNTGRRMPQTKEHIKKRTSKRIGTSYSEESRKKMSASAKNKIVTDETRINMSNGQRGRKHTEETKEKIRQKSLLQRHSDETKRLLSEIHTGRQSTRKGTVVSPESREKMSIAQKNILEYDDCIHCGVTMDLHNLKRYHNDNCRVINPNIIRNQYNKGKEVSNETKEKLSLKAKNRKKIQCEYCDKIINQSAYTRFHGDNCKHKYTNHQEK